MKLIAPHYYKAFQCIADKCRHSCCIGWEIDVDADKLAYYRSVPGPLGDRLRAGIDHSADPPHFILSPDARCPFLNKNGLCDLILGLGEDSLCQICRDHPRYRSFFSDRTEIGLGLCCEAAAALILGCPDKTHWVTLQDDGGTEPLLAADASLLAWRERLIGIAQDRSRPVEARAAAILDEADVTLTDRSLADWADLCLSLERLEHSWTGRLEALRETDLQNAPALDDPAWQTAFEQLLVYFLGRHLPGALDDGDYEGRAAFAVLGYTLIRALCRTHALCCGTVTFEDLVEIARQYSAEIEYSDDNTEALLDALFEA